MTPNSMQQQILDVLIVGGGLSGMYVAQGLLDRSNWKLLEASVRLGGRLANATPSCDIDMGGAWIWPRNQPHMKKLAASLHLITFPQPDDPSSTRTEGGAVRFIDELYKRIDATRSGGVEDEQRIILSSPVVSCKLLVQNESSSESLIEVETANGTRYLSKKVVFAIPPRLLSESVSFDPPLSREKRDALSASRTWMSGVTKVALVYPTRFWDLRSSNMGLPASSGPAFQVYDSSIKDSSISALTFFALVPPGDTKAQMDDAFLAKQVAGQIESVWKHFGELSQAKQAHSYSTFHVLRWPSNPYTSGLDTLPATIHPHPHPVRALSTPEWDGRLLFAGTETDQSSPGVMEGAVGAAKRVLGSILG